MAHLWKAMVLGSMGVVLGICGALVIPMDDATAEDPPISGTVFGVSNMTYKDRDSVVLDIVKKEDYEAWKRDPTKTPKIRSRFIFNYSDLDDADYWKQVLAWRADPEIVIGTKVGVQGTVLTKEEVENENQTAGPVYVVADTKYWDISGMPSLELNHTQASQLTE